MPRFLIVLLLLVAGFGPLGSRAQTADGLPARPTPFQFVTDEANVLSAADAQKLESGLRRYADNTGTQLVVVTVPTLGGRDVADYGRALGTAWGIGQRDKNNGIVLLVAAQERKVTIQAGSGLRSQITPALTARVINEQLTPSFKQGNYFAGLHAGLNTLMLAANPSSDPRRNQTAPATAPADEAVATGPTTSNSTYEATMDPGAATGPESAPFDPNTAASPTATNMPSSDTSGFGWGTLLLGGAVILGGIWLVSRLFRRRNAAPASQGNAPDFYPNQPTGPSGNTGYGTPGYGNRQQGPDFLGSRPGLSGGGGMGSGMGGALLTGAAAAAGAYLGNRMATGGNEHTDGTPLNADPAAPTLNTEAGLGGAAAGGAAGGGFPFLNNSDAPDEPAPDYFSDSADASPDYFSSDDSSSSYDDPNSGDSGGGGFDDDNSNSGSW